MSSSDSPRPEVPEGKIIRVFTAVESVVYVCLGLLLAGLAFTLITSA
jgi:hypothetical protein